MRLALRDTALGVNRTRTVYSNFDPFLARAKKGGNSRHLSNVVEVLFPSFRIRVVSCLCANR